MEAECEGRRTKMEDDLGLDGCGWMDGWMHGWMDGWMKDRWRMDVWRMDDDVLKLRRIKNVISLK